MANYRVNKHNKHYEVYETQTAKGIMLTESEEDAYEECSFLNNGGGFNGNTPAFFHIKAKRPTFEEHEH